jgi:hydroxymethylpyrimidine pyrophosphatase-like HAD family hydrolase
MRSLVADLNSKGFIIVPVTGSHFQSATSTTGSVLERIENGILPLVGEHHENRSYAVDAYVSDGGALAVKSILNKAVVTDPSYASSVSPGVFNYDSLLTKAGTIAQEFNSTPLTEDECRIIALYDQHAKIDRVQLQPGTRDGHHKAANKVAFYFYAATIHERDAIADRFQQEMKPLGFHIVCCEEKDATAAARRTSEVAALLGNEAAPLKYCLDIVPFTKGSAVNYFSQYIQRVSTELAVKHSVQRPTVEIWACGDAGNDLPLMSSAGVSRVVMVGGASEELVRCATGLQEEGKQVFVDTTPGRLGPASIAAAVSLWAEK